MSRVQSAKGSRKVPVVQANLNYGAGTKRFRHKQGAVFGTATKKEKIEDLPGPGVYEPNLGLVHTRSQQALILSDENRHGYISQRAGELPGPGQYIEGAAGQISGDKAGSQRAGKFDMSKRETEFDKVAMNSARIPGPAEYTKTQSKEQKGPSFGVKRDQKPADTPGPGAYDSLRAETLRRPQSSKAAFSRTQRTDLWKEEKNKNQIGPAYDGVKSSFDATGKKGPTFGSKRKTQASDTPGPGTYSQANVIQMVKSKGASVKIGMTKRPDNFTRNDMDLPGPGNYPGDGSTFGKTMKGAAGMGSKYKPLKNDNPGPGQYDSVKSSVKQVKNNCKIGTTKRPDIWNKEQARDAPGPGNYPGDGSTFGKSVKGAAGMGSKYKPLKNENPGPGQYNASLGLQAAATYGKMSSAKRQDIFDTDKKAIENLPGPGQHSQSYSSFGKAKGVANFGIGRKDRKNENPGPGQYNQSDRILKSAQSQSVRFGQTRRPDIWEKDTKRDIPGPGNYADENNTFGKAAKGNANMGSKYKAERNTNPGPGQYDYDASKLRPKTGGSVRMGSEARKDLWADKRRDDLPGPGNYADENNTFGKAAKGNANMGSKYKSERNLNPGPGEYDADASKLKPKTGASVRIGSEARKDLWADKKRDDLPGPGNYADENNTFAKAARGTANMGSKYKPERNSNPGPGQYVVNESPSKKNAASFKMSMAQKKDIWADQTGVDAPGPGNYQEKSTFSNIKGNANMGSKYKPERNSNPGPGQYEQAQHEMSSHQKQNVKIGQSKAREDIFGTDQAASLPGPGAYVSPEQKTKGFVFGKKHEEKVSDTPGPGNYSVDPTLTQKKEVQVKLSKADRGDIWKEQTSKADLPGPGANITNDHHWEERGFRFAEGDRFPRQNEAGPGPGAYELLDD